ncbi:MAG: hypothetical protein RL117_884 [Verrucomicrobiota bacterium]|jgi:hypothetical protein
MIQQILTHPGSAHKDEFLACCLLIATHQVPVVRREPSAEDLADPSTLVVDVGGEHDPARGNFDHHQFPADAPPICALSLVMMHLGIYEDARLFCDWLEPAEWFDTKGPVKTAEWLQVPREALSKLHSTIDVTVLRRFAASAKLEPGQVIWELMQMIGSDLLYYLNTMRERIHLLEKHLQFWPFEQNQETFTAVFLPRIETGMEDLSGAISRHLRNIGRDQEVVAMIYPDRRGEGYGLSRHNDHPRLDFTRIADHPQVHFAHPRGFVAKTSVTDLAILREFVLTSWK